MVLPLIIAGLAIDLAKALDRDSEVSAPKSKSSGSSHTSSSEIVNNAGNIPGLTIGRNSVGFTNDDRYYYDDGSGSGYQDDGHTEEMPTDNYDAPVQINVAPRYYDQLVESLYVIQDCGAWDDFSSYPINITSDDASKECSIPQNGRTPYAHSDGERINLCSCIWDLTPIDRAFILMHEWKHIDCRQQGIRYGGDKEERQCDLYALRALNSAGLSTEQIISRFVSPGDFLPGYSPGFDPIVSAAEDNLNTSGVNSRYMKKLEDAFAIIKECQAWDDFTKYPIDMTSDDSTQWCRQDGVGAHTDGRNMNICSCSWDLPTVDLAFSLLHEWKHIDCRQRGIAYTGDPEEKECDMYALNVLHRGGLTTENLATKFVKPGN